ncbi:RNA-directed DNA polymerase [Proteus mirabilis]|nr:retron St85 family RNA-directed DNA polymerase [Proteus mirabilis]MBG5957199.1 RNA-directed DNA polymerase [Proteus mirabilis]
MSVHLYKRLSEAMATPRNTIDSYIRNAPMKYKVYTIPKRTSGQRVIAHPAIRLKKIQRALVVLLQEYMFIHQKAMAYKTGSSIKKNAELHRTNDYILKIDFNDFFNSITPDLFVNYCNNLGLKLTSAEMNALIKILFWNKSKKNDGKLVLSVGAPSSPFISNVILYSFDEIVDNYCNERNIVYSRYADDLSFSTKEKNILFSVPEFIKKQLNKLFSNAITINELKTTFSSKAHNRHITGVTIDNDGRLSIGRERKRYISSLIHKFSLKKLEFNDAKHLQGLFAFACNIEPRFKARMEKKYSKLIIDDLIKLKELL